MWSNTHLVKKYKTNINVRTALSNRRRGSEKIQVEADCENCRQLWMVPIRDEGSKMQE